MVLLVVNAILMFDFLNILVMNIGKETRSLGPKHVARYNYQTNKGVLMESFLVLKACTLPLDHQIFTKKNVEI